MLPGRGGSLSSGGHLSRRSGSPPPQWLYPGVLEPYPFSSPFSSSSSQAPARGSVFTGRWGSAPPALAAPRGAERASPSPSLQAGRLLPACRWLLAPGRLLPAARLSGGTALSGVGGAQPWALQLAYRQAEPLGVKASVVFACVWSWFGFRRIMLLRYDGMKSWLKQSRHLQEKYQLGCKSVNCIASPQHYRCSLLEGNRSWQRYC